MVKRPIHRIHGDAITQEYDTLAEECIITITNDEEVVVRILASPNDLLDLAYGHIHSEGRGIVTDCLLYTSPSPRDAHESRMPSSA